MTMPPSGSDDRIVKAAERWWTHDRNGKLSAGGCYTEVAAREICPTGGFMLHTWTDDVGIDRIERITP